VVAAAAAAAWWACSRSILTLSSRSGRCLLMDGCGIACRGSVLGDIVWGCIFHPSGTVCSIACPKGGALPPIVCVSACGSILGSSTAIVLSPSCDRQNDCASCSTRRCRSISAALEAQSFRHFASAASRCSESMAPGEMAVGVRRVCRWQWV
jgi:hypothetical protein